MELSIRDWMWVIGVLLILAVVLDGYRRAQRERRNQVRLSRTAKKAQRNKEGDEELSSGELPNGGARLIQRREEPGIDPLNPPEIQSERKVFTERTEPKFSEDESPEASPIESAPEEEIDPLFADPFDKPIRADVEEPSIEAEPFPESQLDSPAEAFVEEEEKPAKKSRRLRAKDNERQTSLFEEQHAEQAPVEEIIIMNVLANNKEEGGFAGEDLLHILLACDCRFGEMNIFHQYESAEEKQVRFSVVNIVEPGIFQLDDIKNFRTPGVSFFMRLPGPVDALTAFDNMVETAKCLVKNLDGTLKDENHSTMTEQTLEHSRQRIRDYMQRKLVSS